MTANTISRRSLLSDLAVSQAGASRVFHRHGLDFCCHGRVPLEEACAAKSLDVEAVLGELEAECQAGEKTFKAWDAEPVADLIEHILRTFHDAHRAELPRLLGMARRVEKVHSAKEACPHGLADHIERVFQDMELHMRKEEQILFPLIKRGAGAVALGPIGVMEREHREHAVNLQRMRTLAHNFEAPAQACGTWRALYLGLAELERDLMQHIHLENNVLFPGALSQV